MINLNRRITFVLGLGMLALFALLIVGGLGPNWTENSGASVVTADHDNGKGRGHQTNNNDDEEVVEFAATDIFFEYNATDLDLGLHLFFDAVGWEEVEVSGPDGKIYEVDNGEGLKEIGSTELFTESAEPPLDEENLEQEIADFLALFPEGVYEFEGETTDGKELEGTATLSHNLAAAPIMIFPDPDTEENIADPEDMVLEWSDGSGPGDPEIVKYEAVVEFEEEGGDGRVFTFRVEVPADPDAETQSVMVPPDFFEALADIDGDYKGEIVAIAGDRNATLVENEFELAD
ncbi:MAG: hypothetical protein ACE5Q6_12940 [Dehalococcoidia bacterium]